MERLKKNKALIFIDTHTEGTTPVWSRLGKSTIYDLTMNANIVTSDFIEDEMPTDDVTYYKPSIPQELQTNKGDACFDFIYDMFKKRPTGEDIKKSVLFVFPGGTTTGTGEDAVTTYDAWLTSSSIILKDLNMVDEKIMFDLNINSITDGTCTVSEGVPSFTAN